MVKLFSVKEMQELEKEANASGITYEMMMENAGKGIAVEIKAAYSQLDSKQVVALVGSGNNGGDALVALYYLLMDEWKVYAYIVRKRAEDDPLMTRLINNGGQVVKIEDDPKFTHLTKIINTSSVFLDGVFGTGIKLPLKDNMAGILGFARNKIKENPEKVHVVAVDCPSGVDCDTGEAANETIPAEMTVTMAGVKTGLLKFPAAKLTGRLRIVTIGPIDNLPENKSNQKFIISSEIVSKYLPDRPLDAHKGTFGTAFVIAGSINYTGAALLAGQAAYRAGAGLVTLAIPAPLHAALSGQFPEATWVLLPNEMGVISADAARIVQSNFDRATAILVGPGFGLADTTKEFLFKLFSKAGRDNAGEIGFIHSERINSVEKIDLPIVIDADGLKLVSKIANWTKLLPAPAILTPHPGEMSIISGLPIEEIQSNRLEIALQYAKKWGHVIVLKGAFTVIAAPDGQIGIVPIATPALARAGTGDVLAGLIVGLRAQGLGAFEAACAGTWIHASAGILAAKRLGTPTSVIASDVLNAIPQVISELSSL